FALGVEVGLLDLRDQPVGVAMADALAEDAFDVVLDDLGEAAKIALDRLGLAHEHVEDAVLGPVGQNEVIATHFGLGLQLAVDTPVALINAARIPRQIKVEQVGAVGLEIEPFASGVGGDQDAEWIVGGIGVESTLDLMSTGAARQAINDRDALIPAVRALDR